MESSILQSNEINRSNSQDEFSEVNSFRRKTYPFIGTIRDRKQFSSFLLFFCVIVLVNLCPFHSDQELVLKSHTNVKMIAERTATHLKNVNYFDYLQESLKFVRIMFTNPLTRDERKSCYIMAHAKVLGKMAKVWYIKKKIKKLGKKLKKHTIAVPVLTAIPIYEHSYYPQHPHIAPTMQYPTNLQHAAAASAYEPSFAQIPETPSLISSTSSKGHQTLDTAASRTHSYRVPPHHSAMYHPMSAASAHQIINSYAPSPPLYVDDTGALYGTYGNAYGRFDGGYQYW